MNPMAMSAQVHSTEREFTRLETETHRHPYRGNLDSVSRSLLNVPRKRISATSFALPLGQNLPLET